MSGDQVLTDAQWAVNEPLLPSSKSKRSRPFRDHRQVLEGIVFGYRTGCLWPDVPDRFGPWKTLWKRHARFSKDGTWDRAVERLLVQADAANDNRQPVEPVDHAIGRSRGGLTTKPHTLVDGNGTGPDPTRCAAGRQGLLQPGAPRVAALPGHQSGHPREG